MLSQHQPDSTVAWTRDGAVDAITTAAMMRAHVDGFASLLEPAREGEELLVICRDRYRFAVAVLASWQRGYSVALPPNPQLATIKAIRRRPGVVTVVHDVDGVDKGIDVRPSETLPIGLVVDVPLLKYHNAVSHTLNIGHGTMPDQEIRPSFTEFINGDAYLKRVITQIRIK